MIAYSYYPSAPGGCRAMPVARCCAAIPKHRDSLMLSYTLGFPMQRDVLMLLYTLGFTHAERHPYAVIQAGLPIQRDVLMLSCKLGFPIQRDVLILSCKLSFPIQRDVLMLSYKQGCNPDFPSIAAGGHDIKNEESAQGRCRHMASPCADSSCCEHMWL